MHATVTAPIESGHEMHAHEPRVLVPPRRAYQRSGTRLARRSAALDLFRGLTMAAMIAVASIRTFPGVRPVLHHAPWRGTTVVDLGLPFLLFIVGVAAQLSVDARRAAGQPDIALVRHAAGRSMLLLVVGIIGVTFPNFDPATITLTGVLQRIAVTYFIATLVLMRAGLRAQIALIATVLIGYWLLLTVVPVPGSGLPGRMLIDQPAGTLAAWVDRRVLGAHLDPQTLPWDGEGILPTLVSVTTVLCGALAARWNRRERRPAQQMVGLFAVGALTAAIGSVWGWTFPVIKGLWTSSYVLVTAGTAAMALGLCTWFTRMPRGARWTAPFIALGLNALLAYAGFYAFDELLAQTRVPWSGGPPVPLRDWLFAHLFASWLPSTWALALWAVVAVGSWLVIARILHRRGIVLTV